MNSMTGYGRGEGAQAGFKVTVEISSVNRKQSEIFLTLPRELELLEPQMREVINQQVSRGRLTVRVALQAGVERLGAQLHLNVPLARAYARQLTRLAKELKLEDKVTLDHLTRAPGVFQTDEDLAG